MQNNPILIITTIKNIEIAKQISTKLISDKYASCVDIMPIQSVYEWNEQVCFEDEYKITIKTLAKKYKVVEELLLNMHNYSLPQIIKFDIDGGSDDYIQWMKDKIK